MEKQTRVYTIEWLLILFPSPPLIFFHATRYIALYNLWFSSQKAIIQYNIGLNSVKLCRSNTILPFGTTNSAKFKKKKISIFL